MTVTSANVAGLIAGAGLGWTLTTSLFTGGLRDDDELSDLQVAVTLYSGKADETFTTATARPMAQVTLRGDRDSFNAAEAAAFDLWNYLANVRNVTVPEEIGDVVVGPALIEALTPSGTVLPLGVDEKQRSLFSMNFEVTG